MLNLVPLLMLLIVQGPAGSCLTACQQQAIFDIAAGVCREDRVSQLVRRPSAAISVSVHLDAVGLSPEPANASTNKDRRCDRVAHQFDLSSVHFRDGPFLS